MIAQLFSLFCFGVVISLIVCLGMVQAREFKKSEAAAQAGDSTDGDVAVSAKLRPVIVKQSG